MRSWNPEYWRACQDGFTGTLRQFQSGAKHMTTKTDEARECAEDCAADICHELNIDDNEFNIQNIADQIVKHFQPSVPVEKVYEAIDSEAELSDEPPEEMLEWLQGNPRPEDILEAMRVAVRLTKANIRQQIALIAEAK